MGKGVTKEEGREKREKRKKEDIGKPREFFLRFSIVNHYTT